jgi:hypothetical protein
MSESSTRLSPQEEVATSPLSRAIADVLAHTNLADNDGSADPAAHWRDPEVLDTTRRLVSRLITEGFVADPVE